MTTSQLGTVIATLPVLTPAERGAVLAALGHLEGAKPACQALPGPANAMFEALVTELSALGMRHYVNLEQFSRSRAYKSWLNGTAEYQRFLKRNFNRLTAVETNALTRLLIRALIATMKREGIHITLNTVATNFNRMPAVFDDCFPNYLQSGLAYLVIKQMRKSS